MYTGPGQTHLHAMRTIATLQAGSMNDASDDDKRRAVAALGDCAAGYDSNVGLALREAYVRGSFDKVAANPLAVFRLLPLHRQSPPDRRAQPDAVDTVGFGPTLYRAIADNPIDVVQSDGTLGVGGQSSLQSTARYYREMVFRVGTTRGGMRSLLEWKDGIPRVVDGIDCGQSDLVAGTTGVVARRDERTGVISDPWPAVAAELDAHGIRNDDDKIGDVELVDKIASGISLVYKHYSVKGKSLHVDARSSSVSLDGAAAAAARADFIDEHSAGAGARVIDADSYAACADFCRSEPSFVPLCCDTIQRSLNNDADVIAIFAS